MGYRARLYSWGSCTGAFCRLLFCFQILLNFAATFLFGSKVYLVLLFVFAIRVAIFLVEFSLHGAFFNWQEIFGAIASGVLWPWVFLLMRTTREESDYINHKKS